MLSPFAWWFPFMSNAAAALAAILVVCGAAGARAQDLTAPDGSLIRHTKLELACGDALARFCPDLSETPGQTRNQLICLKPYRTSLSQNCRSTVNAALK